MHFPLFIELGGRPCLVVGDGAVARRKAETLKGFGADVKVVAPERCGRMFEAADIRGMALVVAATNDREVNGRVADLCKAAGIPVNAVDDPENCTFIFPAIVQKGEAVVAVSTGGRCPVASRMLRDRVAKAIPDDMLAAVEGLSARREEMKRRYPDIGERKRAYEEALSKWKE